MEVVINIHYGGFKLSNKAIERYFELKGQQVWFYRKTEYDEYVRTDSSDDSCLVDVYTKNVGYKMVGDQINKYLLHFDRYGDGIERTDPVLIRVVKELGEDASSGSSRLKVVEVPDDVNWEMKEYDGAEFIEEVHRTWC